MSEQKQTGTTAAGILNYVIEKSREVKYYLKDNDWLIGPVLLVLLIVHCWLFPF